MNRQNLIVQIWMFACVVVSIFIKGEWLLLTVIALTPLGIIYLLQKFSWTILRPFKRLYLRYVITPMIIKSADPLIGYPFLIWLRFEGEEIFLKGTYNTFAEASKLYLEELSKKMIDSITKSFIPKKYSAKQLALRRLFNSHDWESIRQDKFMDGVMSGEIKIKMIK